MPTLNLDTIENSRVEETSDGLRIIRGGTVEELPHTGEFDPSVLLAALDVAGMPQVGDTHPIRPSARVTRRLSLPAQAVDIARIEIHYETQSLVGALPETGFRVVRDSTVMTGEHSELDWAGRPIQAIYSLSGAEDITRNVKQNRLVPIRSVVASGLITGKPSINMLKAQGRVNNSPWMDDFGVGYWLCAGLDVLSPAIGNKYAVTATFLTKLHIDWAGYGLIDHTALGTPTDIDPADVDALRNTPYNFTSSIHRNGLVKSAIYGPADLATIFNISG